MKKIIKLITFFLSTLLFTSCCLIDYSEDIKKVAIPMQKELESFYTKNKRFPTIIERNEMLEKVGCIVEGEVCFFEGDRIRVYSQKTSYDYNYNLKLDNTYCTSFMNNKGQLYDIWCQQKPCITFKQ